MKYIDGWRRNDDRSSSNDDMASRHGSNDMIIRDHN